MTRFETRAASAVLSVLVSIACVITRGSPTTDGDAGVFLSVEGRLLAGDKLYKEVFDNKDPLFYYTQSVALEALGWLGPFLLDVVWVAGASMGAYLLTWAITRDRIISVAAQLLYPLALTGPYYFAGYNELPGLALLPVFALLVYRGSLLSAGFVAAGILLLRLSLFPFVLAVGIVSLVPTRRALGVSLRNAGVLFGTMAAVLATSLAALALRGELVPYLDVLTENVAYAERALETVRGTRGAVGHLRFAAEHIPAAGLGLVCLALGAVAVAAARPNPRRRLAASPLTALTAATALASVLIIASTALWSHHLIVLALPATCVALLALQATAEGFAGSPLKPVASGTIAVLFIAGATYLRLPAMENVRSWADAPEQDVSDALQRAATVLTQRDARWRYFHMGANSERAHGAFLPPNFRLACPRFHQYPWLPPKALRETIECVKHERPQLIAVTPTLRESQSWANTMSTPAAWTRYVRDATAILESRCRPVVVTPSVSVYGC
jgi:hypothetical protein